MAKLTVEFQGICTHFNRLKNSFLDLPHAHRVVLTHWPGGITWNGTKIPEHQPKVYIELQDGQRQALDLGPSTLRLPEIASAPPLTWQAACSPSLPGVWPAMQLRPEVVVDHAKPAALYVDLDQGTLVSFAAAKSAAVRVEYEIEGPQAELIIEPWDGDQTSVWLPLPSTLRVTNVGVEGESVEDCDFILHYALVDGFPDSVPADQALLDSLQRTYDAIPTCLSSGFVIPPDLGPGCSNSHFP